MKNFFSFILRISITAGVLFFLFKKIDIMAVYGVVKNLNPWFFLSCLLVYCFIISLSYFRWQILLHALDLRVRKRRVILALLGGLFFNLFLPSTVGGDLIKGIDLFGHTKQGSRVAASVILDRMSGFAGLAVLSFVALMLAYNYLDLPVITIILILFFSVSGIFYFILHKRLTNRIFDALERKFKFNILKRMRNLYDQLSFFAERRDALYKTVGISIFGHLLLAVLFFLLVTAMGVKTKILYFTTFIPIITAVSTIPISIGGLGVRDATSVYLLSKVGIAQNVAVATSLITFFFMTLTGTIGGIIYVFTFRYRRLQSHQAHLPGNKRSEPGSEPA